MPEGDTVWRAARALDRALSGQVLTRTDFRVPQHATADLAGGVVTDTVSRGKHLLTRISMGDAAAPDDNAQQEWTLHTHLKMEGAWRTYAHGERWRRPAHQARVVLETSTTVAVGFTLGIVELVPRAHEAGLVAHLGPDLLGVDWDEDEAVRRLQAAPERSIHEALLDQRNLAGIGNLYAAELCFTSGVHPATPVAEAGDLVRLVRRARLMLDANKERPEQTTTGDLHRGRRTWVYRQDGRLCRRCRTPIEVSMIGPARLERAAYWCPTCQPATARRL